MPKKRANWYLQRAEGKAAMASYLGAAGPRVTEQQWWDRRAQARRAEVPRGATAVPAPQQASCGRKRAQLQGVRKPAARVAGQQRHLHMVSESRVAETLLLRKVFLVEPVRGLSGSWIPACLWRDDFEEAWWCDGVFAGAGEDWAVRHGFAEIIISKAQRAGPGPARGREAVRGLTSYGKSGRRQTGQIRAELSPQRVVSQEESLRRSAAAEATNARLQAMPALNALLPSSWDGSAGQSGSRSGRWVEGRDLGDSLVRNVASAEAKRGGKGAAERAAARAVERLRASRGVQVRDARASLIYARRLQELAVPQGTSAFITVGVLQAGSRAMTAAKRKFTEALAGGSEQPGASSRGQRMAAIAAAAADEKLSIL